jgi:hypothetical protein
MGAGLKNREHLDVGPLKLYNFAGHCMLDCPNKTTRPSNFLSRGS